MARRLTKEQIISIIYYDVDSGFGSVQETVGELQLTGTRF